MQSLLLKIFWWRFCVGHIVSCKIDFAKELPFLARRTSTTEPTSTLQQILRKSWEYIWKRCTWWRFRLPKGIRPWASQGSGRGTRPFLDFEIWHFPITILAIKVVFLVSRGKNEISPLLAPLWKDLFGYFWKNPVLAPWKNPFDAHAFVSYVNACRLLQETGKLEICRSALTEFIRSICTVESV